MQIDSIEDKDSCWLHWRFWESGHREKLEESGRGKAGTELQTSRWNIGGISRWHQSALARAWKRKRRERPRRRQTACVLHSEFQFWLSPSAYFFPRRNQSQKSHKWSGGLGVWNIDSRLSCQDLSTLRSAMLCSLEHELFIVIRMWMLLVCYSHWTHRGQHL